VYEPGERSGAWIKHRTNKEQEFVVGGYIPGSHGFDALLVGVYENKRLMFVAKVKNGFLPSIRPKILRALEKLRTSQCPFENLPEERASRWGEALTAEKMKSAVGSNRTWFARWHSRMDRCRSSEALQLRRHAR
jgi:bifunctional non-homologous end joining protein LigD